MDISRSLIFLDLIYFLKTCFTFFLKTFLIFCDVERSRDIYILISEFQYLILWRFLVPLNENELKGFRKSHFINRITQFLLMSYAFTDFDFQTEFFTMTKFNFQYFRSNHRFYRPIKGGGFKVKSPLITSLTLSDNQHYNLASIFENFS